MQASALSDYQGEAYNHLVCIPTARTRAEAYTFEKGGNMKKVICLFLIMIALGAVLSWDAFADTIVTTGPDYPYFRSSSNPVAAVFYFVGDLLALPFRFVGSLID